MQLNKRVIFVATDFSEPADEALRQAHVRARALGARLVVCHVVPNMMRINMLFPQRHQEETDARRKLHERARQALVERACKVTGRAASELEPVVDDGPPYASIVEHAERVGAELIVVGDRGTTGLSRVLLGSVAERVVRYAHAPVLVARTGPQTGKVLVATDLSDPSLPAVAAAAVMAREEGARVTALFCLESVGGVAVPELGVPTFTVVPGTSDETRRLARERVAEALTRFGLHGDSFVIEGPPAASIVRTAEDFLAELVIVGTRGRTGLRRVLLGSVAESVVRHAPCSVLVVRLGDAARTTAA